MQKVTINGVAYIGKLKEKDGELCLVKAMQVKKIDKDSIAEYLKRKNIGELESLQFGGNGVSYSISDLTDEQHMQVDIAKLAMAQAKRVASAGTENKIFDGIMGKM